MAARRQEISRKCHNAICSACNCSTWCSMLFVRNNFRRQRKRGPGIPAILANVTLQFKENLVRHKRHEHHRQRAPGNRLYARLFRRILFLNMLFWGLTSSKIPIKAFVLVLFSFLLRGTEVLVLVREHNHKYFEYYVWPTVVKIGFSLCGLTPKIF